MEWKRSLDDVLRSITDAASGVYNGFTGAVGGAYSGLQDAYQRVHPVQMAELQPMGLQQQGMGYQQSAPIAQPPLQTYTQPENPSMWQKMVMPPRPGQVVETTKPLTPEEELKVTSRPGQMEILNRGVWGR